MPIPANRASATPGRSIPSRLAGSHWHSDDMTARLWAGPSNNGLPARHYLWLGLAGLAFGLFAAWWVRAPGYMDADYYYATGRELSAGRGFNEPFLWNYLDDPQGLPHPSHLYWMPLASILAAGSMRILGESFRAAQLPFLLLTAALAPLTAALAQRLTGDAGRARQAGLLAACSGFFLPFFVTTDAFSLYAILGGGALWAMAEAGASGKVRWWLLAGLSLGLCHASRADAPILFVPALYVLFGARSGRRRALAALLLGYAVVMGPWFTRNLIRVGAPLNPGGMRVLWLLSYDELFSYPASRLNLDRWLEAGLPAQLTLRLQAAWTMLQRTLAENGLVFLAPFMLLGARRLWSRLHLRIAIIYLGLLFAVMCIFFPTIGARGAYFHASVAAMPVLWSAAPIGVDAATEWWGARRRWNVTQARKVFTGGAVAFAALFSLSLAVQRLILPAREDRGWGAGAAVYQALAKQLEAPEARRPVAVNNPPGFYVATAWPAVVIPNGEPDDLRQVVERFGVGWVVLESNHPQGLDELYAAPDSLEWLTPIASQAGPDGSTAWLLAVKRATAP